MPFFSGNIPYTALILNDSLGLKETIGFTVEIYVHKGPRETLIRRETRSLRPLIFRTSTVWQW